MKKVLIITNLFHASPRIPGLAKYLPEFGWQPIILAPPIGENPDSRLGPPNDVKTKIRVIEIPYSNVLSVWRKIWGFDLGHMTIEHKDRFNVAHKASPAESLLAFFYKRGKEMIDYPDADKNWKFFAIKAADELLQKEHIDAMISSSSPVTSHIIARKMKIKHKIPWIADLRDLWTQNHNYRYGCLRKLVERRLELKTLRRADVLVTVSQPWAEKLRVLHRGKRVYVITNGFDPDKMSRGQANLTPKFTITYTGQIYRGKQDPSKLFAALRDLISEGLIDTKDVEVKFYGPRQEWLTGEIEKYKLSPLVKRGGVVPREVSFKKQRESQILLLLNWEDHRTKGWHSLKVYEYLAAQRPVLATGGSGNNVIKELLDETKAGMYCRTSREIKSVLKELYREYKHRGKINYNGDIEKINKYSYRKMARKFASILDDLTNKTGVD